MARRSDHTRDELYEMALAAAREIAEKDGLRGLTARRIAREIGYSPGTLYNVFEDLDDLIVHLNGSTLDTLYEALENIGLDDDPAIAVRALTEGYIRFVRDHPKLWSILFEHHLPDGRLLPNWHHEKIMRLLALLERALAPLFSPGREDLRHHSARVIWSSLHGMVSLEIGGKLVATESVEGMADSLVTNFVAGLRNGPTRSTDPTIPS